MSVPNRAGPAKTAFVFAGGGSFGAIQVGMMHSLAAHGISADNLQDAKLPVHIVTTDMLSGDGVVLSEGSAAQAIIASTAIPGAFAPVRDKDFYLADGAISSNTPIKVAVAKRANLLIILPTGYACSTHAPPTGAVATALHALTLLIARQVVGELEDLDPSIEYFVVPPLCPLVGSPYDFSRTADHIERAIDSTDAWLARNGLQKSGIPDEMRPHAH